MDIEKPINLKNFYVVRKEKGREVEKPLTQMPRSPLPFPYRVKRKIGDDKFNNFLSMLKQFLINIPLVKDL